MVSRFCIDDCYFFESKWPYKTGTYLKVLLMYYFLSRVLSDLKVMGFFYSRSKSQAKSDDTNSTIRGIFFMVKFIDLQHKQVTISTNIFNLDFLNRFLQPFQHIPVNMRPHFF